MSEKHKKVCRTLNRFKPFFVFVSAASKCASIFRFTLLAGAFVGMYENC